MEKLNSSIIEPEFLTVHELATYLNVSEKAVRKWIDAGRLPLVRMGRLIRFSKREIDRRVLSGKVCQQRRRYCILKSKPRFIPITERI
jgi:excisionase family DNA binding protein